ncbi:dienelactone hydrolase family protein [Pseudomonas sp. 10B1]|uniref:alpha/beta family hydrolase n=1 Tax=unclassified Pseudomonas TaxID=196821 RepID=UPI002AB54090|nr:MULTISPECIES: alpha/beta family hydrolase [unclassified Pseudomonas]MDY7561022.1 alpha/beta hydrolase [Pseudomonas sp. AB6]MEA9995049.1 dienelactone hydrolase family protein [Pseudomonas sp. AA4]MEB0089471.1 dienelactone hydrolase family protein [Pseudomonas sp. RTI1]MEB0126835.1 dienelactone hydrolase family protein [Pseudomonas sp. CCC1.2]MEB0152486.1 dienelactone hydrolase family protein [Pseudomonas sp. CCC4.3]
MSNGQRAGIDEDQCAQLAYNNGWLWTPASKRAEDPMATLILAHGAGAPMDSDFMNGIAERLAARGVNVLRFEFAHMAQRRVDSRKRPPNPQAQLLDCWRQVYTQVRPQVAGRLAIGGKSMGGRMASLVADELGVDGLVCLGYPFYAAGKPQKPRVAHLAGLKTPTLIVQGERDALGNRQTVEGYELSALISLYWLTSGDHDLKPLKSSGFTHEEHLDSAAQAVETFLKGR